MNFSLETLTKDNICHTHLLLDGEYTGLSSSRKIDSELVNIYYGKDLLLENGFQTFDLVNWYFFLERNGKLKN